MFDLKALKARRLSLLLKIAKILVPNYRFKWPDITWWEDQEFNRYLERFEEPRGLNADRRWMVSQLMKLVEHLPGDTAECGAYKGATSYLICRGNEGAERNDRTHYIFDSFEGLSEPAAHDGSHWSKGDLAATEVELRHSLKEFPNIQVLKGWIPDRFEEITDRNFCFVHIDVDLYQPTYDSLAFFYPRLVPGGIIVCDDYGFGTCPGVTQVVTEFLADKPEQFVVLSGGGGFLIKRDGV